MANLPLCTHRYFMMVSYIGTRYKGSQRLVKREATGQQDTIQEALEVALESTFARKRCCLTAGSRTDKGVHAMMNCYTLPLMDFAVPTDRFKRLVNQKLVKDCHEIIVNEVFLVPADFHPRKCAVSREYIYRIGVPRMKAGPPAVKSHELFSSFPASELYRILPVNQLDMTKFEEAANLLRGVHDFKSFSFKPREEDDTVRDLEIDITQANDVTFATERSNPIDIYHIRFESRAFLHNQVRRLVGAMLSYASYNTAKFSDIQYLLDNPSSKGWKPNLVIAEPWGLYLNRLKYDKSSFDNAVKTYDDKENEEKVDLKTLPGVIDKNVLSAGQSGNFSRQGECESLTEKS